MQHRNLSTHSSRSTRASAMRLLLMALTASALTPAAASPAAAQWLGREETRDGVVYVMNPPTPMEEPRTVELQELWRLGGESDDENEFFGVIRRVTTDAQGNVYILDSQLSEVKIFSPDGEYLRTIGREGEGPGEFRRPTGMFLLPDSNVGVMQMTPGKIIKLTTKGAPAGYYPLPEPERGGGLILRDGQMAGKNLALHRVVRVLDLKNRKQDLVTTIDLVSPEGKLLSTLEKKTCTRDFVSPTISEEKSDTFENRWGVGGDGKVYTCPAHDEYLINVWSPEGKLLRQITREMADYVRTDLEKERVRQRWSSWLKSVRTRDFRISDIDKGIHSIHTRGNSNSDIWILTSHGSRENPEGSLGTFDVLDSDGHFVRQVTLMGEGNSHVDLFFFDKDRLYVVTKFAYASTAAQGGGEEEFEDDDSTPMEVICYQLDSPVLTLDK